MKLEDHGIFMKNWTLLTLYCLCGFLVSWKKIRKKLMNHLRNGERIDEENQFHRALLLKWCLKLVISIWRWHAKEISNESHKLNLQNRTRLLQHSHFSYCILTSYAFWDATGHCSCPFRFSVFKVSAFNLRKWKKYSIHLNWRVFIYQDSI